MARKRKMTPELAREAEANYFAVCLLMPEDMVHAEMAKLTAAERDIDRVFFIMSERFRVSQQVVALRLADLGYQF